MQYLQAITTLDKGLVAVRFVNTARLTMLSCEAKRMAKYEDDRAEKIY
jgi:hypothetical protein